MGLDRLSTMGMECSYNGYTFGPAADTAAFSCKPNLDPAGRTVMSATYTLTMVDYITRTSPAGTPLETDPVVADAVARLSRNAGVLRYKGRGFGDQVLNAGGGKRDVKWGPVTDDVKLEPFGAGLVVKLTWTVRWTTVNCPDGLTKAGTILQFTFGLSYDVDKEGYTVRVFEGSLTIAQTKKKVDDATLEATADEHLEKMVPKLPPEGFRREGTNRRISLDKCTVTVTVRDVQMSGVMPPLGVVECNVRQSFQSKGLLQWISTLEGDYTVYRGNNVARAVTAFVETLADRVKKAELMKIGDGVPLRSLAGAGTTEAERGKSVKVIPLSATAREGDIYGRQHVELSCTFTLAGVGFGPIFSNSGLWSGLPRTQQVQWKDWVANVPDTVHPRGHARLILRPNDDAIVDACVPGSTPQTLGQGRGGGLRIREGGGPGALARILAEAFPVPPAAQSWLAYQNHVTVTADTGRVVGTTLPAQPIVPRLSNRVPSLDALGGPTAAVPAGSAFPPLAAELRTPVATGGETFVHQRTRPRLYLTVWGYALRAGYGVPVPEVVSINGKAPTLIGKPWYSQYVVANTITPIVRADWSQTYVLTDDGRPGDPGPVPVPGAGRMAG